MKDKMFHIERVGEKHVPDLAQIEKACFAHPWSEDGLRSLTGEDYAAFAAVSDDGKAVAYVGMTVSQFEGNITNIGVLPEYRRQGLASLVLSALVDFAREKGIPNIFLEVRESNFGAIALYEKFGFVLCGRRPKFYRTPTEDALIMALTL